MPIRYFGFMTYRVLLIETEEGFAVGCPALPGCWTQGATREEALENIRDAIQEVLDVKYELEAEQWREDGLEVESVTVDVMSHA
jgi:predicted RNase H-like HicB family nuclease